MKQSKWAQVEEGKAVVRVPQAKVMTKDLPVFYNPRMSVNRSISVALVRVLAKKWKFADILAGSGIRSIRFAKELPKSAIYSIHANDVNPLAVKNIKHNMKLNKVKLVVTQKDANLMLLENSGFDYIDIDPFGSPNPFLDASIKHLKRHGVLAVTATDTAALCGTAVNACKRKYWATPRRDEAMREWGLRILARKVQLVAAQYEIALTPVCSHATDHYFRIYFRRGGRVTDILRQHRMVKDAGPMWVGPLWDASLLKKMKGDDVQELIDVLAEEARVPAVGIFDIHSWCKKLKRSAPPNEVVMKAIRKKGHKVVISHISPTAVRTTMPEKEFEKLMKSA